MLVALSLNVTLGVLWIVIGILMSSVARREYPIIVFFGLSSAIVALVMWVGNVRWGVIWAGGVMDPWPLVLCMIAAGLTNAGGQLLIVVTMRRGHQGVAWAIAQSSMAGSFVATWAIWGESYTPVAWAGIGLMVAAMAMLAIGQSRHGTGRIQASWLLLAIATFLTIAAAQTLMGTPSRWENWEDTARLRIPISLTVGAIVHGAAAVLLRRRLTTSVVRLALVWSLFGLLSYVTMYACFDRLAPFGRTAIVFPIGIGICVLGFSVYSRLRLRESLPALMVCGLVAMLMGIGLLIAGL